MPSESFYIVSLLPPFPELPGNACARSIPKSGYFRSEKKSEKKRVFVTRCTRVRFWPACKRSGSERTSVGRGVEGCRGGRERELGVKQRWSRRENENHTHLRTRSEREGKIGGGERSTLSLPESGNLTTVAREEKRKRERAKRTLIICAFRTGGEQKAPRIL